MKKLFAILLAFSLMAGLASCSNSSNLQDEAADITTEGLADYADLEEERFGESDIPSILTAVFEVLLEWGIEIPADVYHTLVDDPNMHAGGKGTMELFESMGISKDDMILVWEG